jgi:hypothetical protein
MTWPAFTGIGTTQCDHEAGHEGPRDCLVRPYADYLITGPNAVAPRGKWNETNQLPHCCA